MHRILTAGVASVMLMVLAACGDPPATSDAQSPSEAGPPATGPQVSAQAAVPVAAEPQVAIGNRVWLDDGAGGGVANDGIQNDSEAGVSGVEVELYTGAGVLVTSTSTNGTGYYYFDNLQPGSYYVRIPASEFGSGERLEGYLSSSGADSTQTGDGNDNGIDDAAPATNGIQSNTFALAVGTMPTGEDQTGYPGAQADANINATIDFGFVAANTLVSSSGAGPAKSGGGLLAEQSGVEGSLSIKIRWEAKTVKGIPEEGQITEVYKRTAQLLCPVTSSDEAAFSYFNFIDNPNSSDPFAATGSYQQWLNEECTGTLTLDDTYHFNDPTTAGAEPVVHTSGTRSFSLGDIPFTIETDLNKAHTRYMFLSPSADGFQQHEAPGYPAKLVSASAAPMATMDFTLEGPIGGGKGEMKVQGGMVHVDWTFTRGRQQQ